MLHFFYYRFSRMARINSLFLFSALALLSDNAAQIAAGSQPSIVICRIKQIMDVIIFPRTKKETNGSKIANNILKF